MKFQRAYLTADTKTITLHIDIDGKHYRQVHDLLAELEGAEEIDISKHRRKRSNEQNAYMWELIGSIAERAKMANTDVYKAILKDYGIYEILPVKTENIARWADTWSRQGVGWFTEDLGECRSIKGYHNVKTYYGTSSYNSKEMSRVLDGVVQEAKQLGIETLTPYELKRMGVLNE